MDDLINRQTAIDAFDGVKVDEENLTEYDIGYNDGIDYAISRLSVMPSAQPERVWNTCDIPPNHHKDVIVRGVEAIGNVTVYNIMQWDVDRWRPENYAPSITWLDWSEI